METVEHFIDRQSGSLLRSAWLLTGNWASAEDLVQIALLQTWRQWDRIESERPDVYVRRVLMNAFLTAARRRWNGERPVAILPERAIPDPFAAADVRRLMRSALDALPPG